MPWIRRRRQDARDHVRGGPERQQKAGHERVPDDGIQPTGLESPDVFRGTGRRPARLTQPGQLEVVDADHCSRGGDCCPARVNRRLGRGSETW